MKNILRKKNENGVNEIIKKKQLKNEKRLAGL